MLTALVETLVLDILSSARDFAQVLGPRLFGTSVTDPVLHRASLGLGTPTLFAILIEVDDHRRLSSPFPGTLFLPGLPTVMDFAPRTKRHPNDALEFFPDLINC